MPTKAELEEALEDLRKTNEGLVTQLGAMATEEEIDRLKELAIINEELVAQLNGVAAKAGSQEELDGLKAANEKLTATNEGLRVQLQEAEAAGEELVAELEETQIVAQEKLPADCINCGQSHEKVETNVTEEGDVVYHCPVCGHDWTQEHEAAPFRAIRNKACLSADREA